MRLSLSERDRLFLTEMIGAIEEMAVQTDRAQEDVWIEDRTKVAATSMYLIVLGEGAQSLSEELKSAVPDLPWANIAGMRHRLAHGYFRADRRLVFQAASIHAQSLKPHLERLLASLGPESD